MTETLLLPDIHRGVEDLVSCTLEVGSVTARRPIDLRDRDLDVLQSLAELRYLTGQMLGALAWGNYHGRFRSRLSALFSAGLVRRFRPPGRPGANHWVYELAPAGYRALRAQRAEYAPRWREAELHSFAYAEHDLELNALLCELGARAAAHVGAGGPLLRAAPFAMLGPRTGRIDPQHEGRPLEAPSSNELPADHVVRPGRSQNGILEPDATLIGAEATSGEPLTVMIEYDRTRRSGKLIGKLPRYDGFLADGWHRSRYAAFPGEPAVLFVLRDDEHLPHVLREADRELHGMGRPCRRRRPPGTLPRPRRARLYNAVAHPRGRRHSPPGEPAAQRRKRWLDRVGSDRDATAAFTAFPKPPAC